MEPYYAHSENSLGQKEELKVHLLLTASLAQKYAENFGEGIAGYNLGISHDYGKASEMFQSVLKGKEHHVDHATAGAYFLKGHKLLSKVIFAHHDGLKWYIEDDINRSMKEKGSQNSYSNKRFAVSGKEQYDEACEGVN